MIDWRYAVPNVMRESAKDGIEIRSEMAGRNMEKPLAAGTPIASTSLDEAKV